MSDEHEISLVNHPLPPATATELEQQIDTSSALAVIVSFQTFFGMCFLVGTFVLFLIKERATKAKHIQVGRHRWEHAGWWLPPYMYMYMYVNGFGHVCV